MNDYGYEEEKDYSNIIHIILYLVLIIGLGISLFFNLTTDKKTEVSVVEKKSCTSFYDLPSEIKDAYVEKSNLEKVTTSLAELQTKNRELEGRLVVLKTMAMKDEMKSQEKEPEPTIAQETPKINISQEDLSSKVCQDTNITMAKDFAECYNMSEGDYAITKECKRNIINYVDKHKNAEYFEILSLVDDGEFTLFKNLENNNFIYDKLGVTQEDIDKLKILTQRGLAKNRAIEASWVIKAHTNREAKTFNAHYELISKQGNRGVIVRAYEK
jgi:hypothetical protein